MRTRGRPSDTSHSSWKTALTITCQCHTFARNNWTFHNALYCCFEICRIHFSRCHTLGKSIWKCKSHLTSSTTFLPIIDHLKLSPLTAFPSHHQQQKICLKHYVLRNSRWWSWNWTKFTDFFLHTSKAPNTEPLYVFKDLCWTPSLKMCRFEQLAHMAIKDKA